MEKIVKIDGKDVKFKATAGTPRRYLSTFKRDMIKDLQKLTLASQKEETLSAEMLQIFLDAAYVMAKQADPENIPNNADDWLDEFSMFSIYEVLPQIIELWGMQIDTTVESKKNLAAVVEK